MKDKIRLMSDACEMAGLDEEFQGLIEERDALVMYIQARIKADGHGPADYYLDTITTWEAIPEATRKEIESDDS